MSFPATKTAPTPPATTLLPPRLITKEEGSENTLECSVHTLPKALMREFRHVFGDCYLEKPFRSCSDTHTNTCNDFDGIERKEEDDRDLLAIPTNQRARHDLVAIGDEIEEEKDRLLNVFLEFGEDLASKLRDRGYWADYIDPCSGLPMLSKDRSKVYSEVDGMECLLNYKSYNAGFCKILTHPVWGSSVYPATMFAHAPASVVLEVVNSYPISCSEHSTS